MSRTARRMVEETIRVDHAGEYGASRIYKGQLAVLRGTLDELLADPAHRAAEVAWCQVTLTDPARPLGAMEQVPQARPPATSCRLTSSAICTAFNAAPLRRLSPAMNITNPLPAGAA